MGALLRIQGLVWAAPVNIARARARAIHWRARDECSPASRAKSSGWCKPPAAYSTVDTADAVKAMPAMAAGRKEAAVSGAAAATWRGRRGGDVASRAGWGEARGLCLVAATKR